MSNTEKEILEYDDATLLNEWKKLKPTNQLNKTIRASLAKQLLNAPRRITSEIQEHPTIEQFNEIIRCVQELQENMPKQIESQGSLSAVINWNVLINHSE